MKKKSRVAFTFIMIIVIAAFTIYRIKGHDPAAKARSAPTPLVKVSAPERKNIDYTLQYTGDVFPIRQAGIFSKVGGTLEKTFVEMGMSVGQDQILALIDTTLLHQQYSQAAATYYNAKLAIDRARELFRQSLISKEENDNADVAERVANANLELAATQLGYARITAPFPGIITRRFLDPGASVTPNNVTLFTLMDLSNVKVIINVLEKDISLVSMGQSAVVVVDAYPGVEFTGLIARFSEAVDPATRTMAVEVDIANPKHQLKPGMYAKVALRVEQHENALTIPAESALKDERGLFVYTVKSDTAHKVYVTTGISQEPILEVLSGITDVTEKVITVGQQLVRDGGAVNIQK